MKKKIIIILLVLFLTGNVFGQQLGFQAIENGGKVTITGYTGNEKNLTIPGTANGMPIVAIGDEAFRGKGLTSITIPASVNVIGFSAFAGNQLTSITIGANVTLVVDDNYYDNFSSFGNGFDNAYNNGGKPAGTYKRDSTNSSIWGMTSGNFLYIGSNITRYTGSGGAVTIPSTINGTPVTSIEREAFNEKRLTSVTIPNSIKTIGNFAFSGNQLTSVNIPNSVITIGPYAFSGNQLTSVNIPNSVRTIGYGAFEDNRLISITIGPNVELESGDWGSTYPFPYSFVEAYNGVAGTYTRPSTSSNTWTKGAFTF